MYLLWIIDSPNGVSVISHDGRGVRSIHQPRQYLVADEPSCNAPVPLVDNHHNLPSHVKVVSHEVDFVGNQELMLIEDTSFRPHPYMIAMESCWLLRLEMIIVLVLSSRINHCCVMMKRLPLEAERDSILVIKWEHWLGKVKVSSLFLVTLLVFHIFHQLPHIILAFNPSRDYVCPSMGPRGK
jgi:hypothetical protein